MFLRNLTLRVIAAVSFAGLLVGCENKQAQAYAVVHGAKAMPEATRGQKPVLEVIADNQKRTLTMAQLESMRAVEYRVAHPHIKRTATFQGVLVEDLAVALGIEGRDLRFEALDDYGAVIKAEDYEDYPILLAYRGDGKPLTIKDKGPLTIIFPIHAHADRFPGVKYGSQWVWYVSRVKAQ